MDGKDLENGLFIFRRDYRIVDNNGLNLLNTLCKNVYTVFIFTPEQVGNANKYKSDNSVQFMIESLTDLRDKIKQSGGHLYSFYGENPKIIENLIKSLKIDIVCFNCDYTPYSIKRDVEIIQLCKRLNIEFTFEHDYYLHHPNTIMNGSKEPYQKFTPYYTASMKLDFQVPSSAKN